MKFEPDKKLFSREHVLADDLATMLGEPGRFAAYLGIAKRYRESDLRATARYVREKADLPREARGKYFFACLRGLYKIPVRRIRRIRRAKKKKRNKKPNRSKIKNGKTTPHLNSTA